MKEILKITIIQPDIIWENREANLEKYSTWIENLEETDLIVLPEMFTTGFSMDSKKLSEKMNGPSIRWMQQTAAKTGAALVGSLVIEDNNQIFNRAIWAHPDGKVESYDKRHLFTMGQEHHHYTPGKEKTIVEYIGWKFCPLICYDLRFPVWSRNQENYDVVLYMANWPSPRHHVWKTLLIARAVENQAYCIGITRTGTDGDGLEYLGESALISPKGDAQFMGSGEEVKTYEISWSELHEFKKRFPVLNDKDQFEIHS